jgi:hypothetical protein
MTTPLMPAKAGIQSFALRMRDTVKYWVPAFAGTSGHRDL